MGDPRDARLWPEPTTEEPSEEDLTHAVATSLPGVFDGICDATDGCMVEPDGVCEHGHPSWLIRLGYI